MIEATMLYPVCITTIFVVLWLVELAEGLTSVKTTIGAVVISGVSWLLWHYEPYDSFMAWVG